MRRWIVLVAVVGTMLWVGGADPASACSCAEVTDEQALAMADVAFAGRVVEKREPRRLQTSADPALWVFEASQVYKGSVAAVQGVYSPVSGASCGLEFGGPGSEVLVFASRERDRVLLPDAPAGALKAHLCNGSRAIEGETLDASLGHPKPPSAGTAGIAPVNDVSWRWMLAGGFALAVSVAGLGLVRRRRQEVLGA